MQANPNFITTEIYGFFISAPNVGKKLSQLQVIRNCRNIYIIIFTKFFSNFFLYIIFATGTPPTSRSGHRMVLLKRHLVIFGGFHDNLSECKYFNDIHVFSLEERSWRKVTISGQAPGPRSGCCMVCLQDGRILVKIFFNFAEIFICLFLKCPYYFNFTISKLFFPNQIYGGFCKEKKSAGGRKKDAEEAGKTMADMYLLAPESEII